MKTQLIKLENYNIIVSDEKLTNGCYGLTNLNHVIKYNIPAKGELEIDYKQGTKKIIASTNPEHNLPSINYNGLEGELGIIENPIKSFGRFILQITNRVIKKNSKLMPLDNKTGEELLDDLFNDWLKAQKLNEKKFSLEDMRKAYREGFKQRIEPKPNNAEIFFNSLQQPKVFDIEIEMEVFTKTVGTSEFDFMEQDSEKPKITNNQIKILAIK